MHTFGELRARRQRPWLLCTILAITFVCSHVSAAGPAKLNPKIDGSCIEHNCSEPENVVAYYTELLAWFTAVLAVASLIQNFFIYSADVTARIAAKAAKETAETQHGYSKKQIEISERQTQIQASQQEIQNRQFLATNRPQMVVHAVQYAGVSRGIDRRLCASASILCFNKGTKPARAVSVRSQIAGTKALGIEVPRPVVQEVRLLDSGTKLRFSVVSERSLAELSEAHETIYCIGTIEYWDDANVSRETGFCYRLELESLLWVDPGLSEYSYAY